MTRGRATLIGLSAVGMWSTLGLFTAQSGGVPPFLLNALCFGFSGMLALLWIARAGGLGRVVPRAPSAILHGVAGLFGYHFFYFTALRNAPPVEANLINYLWPLLIVVFSGLLPGERLHRHHLLGAALGFVGAGLLVTGGKGLTLDPAHVPGYAAAVTCALFWGGYSVLSRRFSAVGTESVALYCLLTAGLSTLCHLAFETTVWPADAGEWLAVAGLGALPVGAAFFVWDIGMKHGDMPILGAAAYAAPLFSTFLLIGFGFGVLSWPVAVAALLITGGALVAARDMLAVIARRLSGRRA